MTDRREGIHPFKNFWTYRRIGKAANRNNWTIPLRASSNWETEEALGDKHHPMIWRRENDGFQRKLLLRLEGATPYRDAAAEDHVRTVYMVLDHANRDSGVRIAWAPADRWVVGGTSDPLLGVNLLKNKVYEPPRNLRYCWSTPNFAAIYALNDVAGWRDWSASDEKFSLQHVPK